MLTCIPTNSDVGLDASLADHFGSAPFFTLYDSETGELNVLHNRNAHHSHGTCHPMNQLAHYRIDAIVCTGIGRRAIEALNSEGIRAYQAKGSRVGEVVEQFKTGQLAEFDPACACRGHGQHVAADYEHRPGRGAGFGQGGGRGQGRGQGRSGDGRL